MMLDDRFEDTLRDAAQEYNRPPETPRELMWARIEATRRERARQRGRFQTLRAHGLRWGIGVAAALVIGIAIGRYTMNGSETRPIAVGPTREAGPAPGAATMAFRLATTEHLTTAEAILTSFRADPRIGEVDAEFFDVVRRLLSSTRLLLDSPAAEDPAIRELLEDLELVLVQISQLSYQDGEGEIEIIDEGMENRGLLPRLRSFIPAGPVVAGA